LFSPPTADDLDGIFGGSTGLITHLGSGISPDDTFSDISIGYRDGAFNIAAVVDGIDDELPPTPLIVILDIRLVVLVVSANGKGFQFIGGLFISDTFADLLAMQHGQPATDFVGKKVGEIATMRYATVPV
jgi:hypothetical protein